MTMDMTPSDEESRVTHEPWARVKVYLVIAIAIGLSPLWLGYIYGLYVYGDADDYALAQNVALVLSIGTGLSFVGQLVSFAGAVSSRKYAAYVAMFAGCLVFQAALFAIIFPMLNGFGGGREKALVRIMESGEPLIDAIERYQADHNGIAPRTLDDLVPKYLERIPGTDVGCYPTFRYFDSSPSQYPPSPWVLDVSTPAAFLDFDTFFYVPSENYHATEFLAASVRRVETPNGRTWGYFNE